MEQITVSIILPTYNGAGVIAGAIESVLAQTFLGWELLILSDGSTDQTKDIVEHYKDKRIVFIENEHNLGIQKTLNKGLELAKGKYIARIDDDDRWISSEKLFLQVEYLNKNKEYVLVGTNAVVVNEKGEKISSNLMPGTDSAIREKMHFKNCFLHASVLIKKTTIDAVGGYSEEKRFLHVEDYELWARLGTIGKMSNLQKTMVQLINHNESITFKNRILQAKNALHVLVLYKTKYPHFITGYFVSYCRYIFFSILKYVPISNKLFYFIQRTYKKI